MPRRRDRISAATGAALDLVIAKGRRRIAIECKTSSAPVSDFWKALADLHIDEAWIVAPMKESYPLRQGVTVAPLEHFLRVHRRAGRLGVLR